jgi:hypothetical protein
LWVKREAWGFALAFHPDHRLIAVSPSGLRKQRLNIAFKPPSGEIHLLIIDGVMINLFHHGRLRFLST